MKSKKTKLKFLKLRGAGYSFAKISKYLRVSKWTLIRWAKQHNKILSDLQKIHLESLKESIFMSEKNKLELLVKDFYQLDSEFSDSGKSISEREILARMKYSVLDRIVKFEKNFDLKIFDDDFDMEENTDLKYLEEIENLEIQNTKDELISQKTDSQTSNLTKPIPDSSKKINHENSFPEIENISTPEIPNPELPDQIYYHKFKPVSPNISLPLSENDENDKKDITFKPSLIVENGSHSFGEIPFSDYVNTHLYDVPINETDTTNNSDNKNLSENDNGINSDLDSNIENKNNSVND
ncbi:MAG TPA: hypothetical protein DEP28_01325 [Bacteroidetes bacterium]|mgnify:CR=1 FL=1|nr:hypothetical protein [Bacteroidota bacterium]